MAHYFLGHWADARIRLEALARRNGALEGGKGSYWLARIDERLGDRPAAIAGYTRTVTRFPFSWYALLARARLAGLGAGVAAVRRRRLRRRAGPGSPPTSTRRSPATG